MAGDTFLSAAVRDDDGGNASGSAYFFSFDQDGEGIGDSGDADIDGGGIPNVVETANGLDPNDPTDETADFDGDGWRNIDELRLATGINDLLSTPLGRSNWFSVNLRG